MAEFELNPLNPMLQLAAIGIGGLIIPLIFAGWLRWVIWGIGIPVWFYANFMHKFKEGAVKNG